jgi:hypothetical protein
MSDLIINGRVTQAHDIVRLQRGQEQAALAAAKANGADDVFFKLGDDTYVASAASMNLRGTKAGQNVYLDGKKATITAVDNQMNGLGEGLLHPAGDAVAVGGIAYGLFTFAKYAATGWGGLGVAYAGAAAVAGLAINLVPTLFGHFRAKDFEAVKRFGANG